MFLYFLLTVALCSQLSVVWSCEIDSKCCGIQDFERRLNELKKKREIDVTVVASGVRVLGTDLSFPNLDMNNGGGYNTATGVFTAPVPGVYFIALTISPREDKANIKVECFILINGIKKVRLFTDKFSEKEYGAFQATVTMSADLKKNDVIKVGDCKNGAGIRNDRATSFHISLRYKT